MRYALASLLTPDPVAVNPDGWTNPDSTLTASLPITTSLTANVQAKMIFPLGLAKQVVQMDGSTVLDSSTEQWETYPAIPTGDRLDPLMSCPKFVVKNGAVTLGIVPFVSGYAFGVGSTEHGKLSVQIQLNSWQVCLGNLRETGTFGSRVDFSFRQADKASNSFDIPKVHPYVVMREIASLPALQVAEVVILSNWWIPRIYEELKPMRGRSRKKVKK